MSCRASWRLPRWRCCPGCTAQEFRRSCSTTWRPANPSSAAPVPRNCSRTSALGSSYPTATSTRSRRRYCVSSEIPHSRRSSEVARGSRWSTAAVGVMPPSGSSASTNSSCQRPRSPAERRNERTSLLTRLLFQAVHHSLREIEQDRRGQQVRGFDREPRRIQLALLELHRLG